MVSLVQSEHVWWNLVSVESGVRKSAAGGYTRSLISSALSYSLSLSFFGVSGHGWGSFLLWNPLVKRAGSRHRNGFKRLSWAAVASCRNGSFRWLDSCRGMWQVAGLCLLLCVFFFFPPLHPSFSSLSFSLEQEWMRHLTPSASSVLLALPGDFVLFVWSGLTCAVCHARVESAYSMKTE